MTDTIYGSTLSIPELFLRASFIKEATTRNTGTRLKVEVTSGLPFHGKPSPRSGWEVNEISGDFPRSGPARHPLGGFIKGIKVETGLASSPAYRLGAPMDGLIELVAASFARHGIECPVDNSHSARPATATSVQPTPTTVRPAEATLTSGLPEHNFRKGQQGDTAP